MNNKYILSLLVLVMLTITGCFESGVEDMPPGSYPVDTKASHGGSIAPQELEVEAGKSTSFTVKPRPGFKIDTVTGCQGSLVDDVYTTGPVNGECLVVAEFSALVGNVYEVTSRAASGTTRGDIYPPRITALESSRARFFITHNPGFVPHVTGCRGTLENGVYTSAPITQDCQVAVTFEPISGDLFAVTAAAGFGGDILPEYLSVPNGEKATFEVVPGRGFSAHVTGCGGQLVNGRYIVEEVSEDCHINAEFVNEVPDSHLVKATIEEGGSVSPSLVSIQDGAIIKFAIETDIDRAVDEVVGCSGSFDDVSSTYITDPITTDCEVDVLLGDSTPPSHHVGVMATGNGSASPESAWIQEGSSAQIELIPDLGYRVDSATGCGGFLEGDIYTTQAVTEDCLVVVYFEDALAETFKVSTHAKTGGSIKPGSLEVADGSRAGFKVTPNDGYEIDRVYGCGGALDEDIYTTGPITGPCTVTASFEQVYTVTTAVVGGGHVDPERIAVPPGSRVTFNVRPDEGNKVKDISSGCGGYYGGPNDQRYYIQSVDSDCQVAVTFDGKPIISGLAIGSGTISPESQQVNTWAEEKVFNLEADDGWYLDDVVGCNGEIGYAQGTHTYTTRSNFNSCEFIAHFKEHTLEAPVITRVWTTDATGRIYVRRESVEGATGYNWYLGYDYPPTPNRYSTRITDLDYDSGYWFGLTPGRKYYVMVTAYYGDTPDEQESGPSNTPSAIAPE